MEQDLCRHKVVQRIPACAISTHHDKDTKMPPPGMSTPHNLERTACSVLLAEVDQKDSQEPDSLFCVQ